MSPRIAIAPALRRAVLAAGLLLAALLALAPGARAATQIDIGVAPNAANGGHTFVVGIAVRGTDAAGKTVRLAIDGVERPRLQLGADGRVVTDVGPLSTGQHRIYAQFEDGTADTLIVHVDASIPAVAPEPSGEPDGPADNDPYDPHPQGSDPTPKGRTLRASGRVPRKAKRKLTIKLSRRLGTKASTSYLVRLIGRGRTVATGSVRNRTLVLLVRTRNGRVPKLDGVYTLRGIGTPTLRTTRLMLR